MIFKSILISSLFFVSGFAWASTHDISVFLRPRLVDSLIEIYNTSQSPFHIDSCLENQWQPLRVQADVQAKLGQAQWTAPDSLENQYLKIDFPVQSLQVDAGLQIGCDDPMAARIPFRASLTQPLRLELGVEPQSGPQLRIAIAEKSIRDLIDSLKILSPESPRFEALLQEKALRTQLALAVRRFLQDRLTSWTNEMFRGLVFAQSIPDLLLQSSVWSGGIAVQKGSLILSNAAPAIHRKQLYFGFYPQGQNYCEIIPEGIAFFAEAQFLGEDELKTRFGSRWSEVKTQEIKDELLDELDRASKKSQKTFPAAEADFTLTFPESLINDALKRIYLEDLLRFDTRLKFGEQIQGKLTKNTEDLDIRVELGSETIPQIKFLSNALELTVRDYFLKIGTWMEDRLIPSSELTADVNVQARFIVDNQKKTLNLALDPESFQIKLQEKQRPSMSFDEDSLQLLAEVAEDVWVSFFSEYQDLTLFPSLIETDILDLEIVKTELWNGNVLAHINFVLPGESVK